MMHTAYANASPFTAGLSAARNDAPVLQLEATTRPVRVSALGEPALRETKPELVALTSTPSLDGSGQNAAPTLYTADIAALALGLVGAWLLLVGMAMLARHLRLVRLGQT